MADVGATPLTNTVREAAHPLAGAARDYDPLMELVGDTRFVLIGEASHGTHEFYHKRAQITKRLITEKGFTAMAVEADWPDAYRVNCYVRGASGDADASEALGGFQRFPTWMWRNTVVRTFVEWLRAHNEALPSDAPKVGFYGLDLYSLFTSIEAVVGYLDKVDPEAARRARERYACLEQFGRDSERYGYATGLGLAEPCEDEVASSSSCNTARPSTRAATVAWRRTTSSTRNRTRGSRRTPSTTTARRSAVACRRGTCAIATWRRRSMRWLHTSIGRGPHVSGEAGAPKSWSGPTTRTLATRGRRRWAIAVS
jgi:erythromycin esterase-like protein